MDRHNLLIHNFIGKETNWNRREEAEAFLRAFVAKVEPNAQVEVTNEEFFLKEQYTLRLSIGNKQTRIPVSYEELTNCNSLRVAEKSQKELAEKIRHALGDIARQHRRLGFIK